MNPLIFFSVLAALYLVLFFFDRFFKSCMLYPYDQFLKNTGLQVQFMRLKWHTTAFNRAVFRWGTNSSCTRSWLTKSFTIGVLVALSLLPIGIIVIFMTIFSGAGSGGYAGSSGSALKSDVVQLEIMLPGVNLPLEEIGFYVTTLLFSTIVHELGHALAAVLEDVPVTGFGFQIFFCIPLAYTEISNEHLNALKWFKRLRILCAGIWHNVLFAALCYLLFSTLGFVAAPFYTLNKNVIITDITKSSPLRARGEKGLVMGDIISQINDCAVYNEHTWYACLLQTLRSKPGYCVSSDFIRLNDESIDISHHGTDGVLQCCDDKNAKLCCFEYIDDFSNDAPVEIPQHVCLNVRQTIEDSFGYCVAGTACDHGFCLRPLLRNTTTIINLKRIEAAEGESKKLRDIIYVGHPADVARTVRISPFVPKQQYFTSYWGDIYSLFLKYNIVFSVGLALVNAIPCFGLDGYHITGTIINSFLVNRVSERAKRDVISLIVTGIGTLLFVLGLIKVLWLSVIRKMF